MVHHGPKLQQDLLDVLLRFRKHPVRLICDIAEMYLQIEIAPEDRPYHRFLWRDLDQQKDPDVYEFNCVVFGVNSSPFLAQFVTQEHARIFKDRFPIAAETILKSAYMDDSMDSVLNEDQGIELYHQLTDLWAKAGMKAHKWLSNSVAVLQHIPIEKRSSEIKLEEDELPSVKTLGLVWHTDEDVFGFHFRTVNDCFQFTKRQWRYIPSKMNPADLVFRGVLVHQLYDDDTWLTGPDFPTKEEQEWPPHRLEKRNSINDETRKCRSTVSAKNVDSDITLMTTQNMEENWLDTLRYSSCVRLVRVTAWLVRFIDNFRAHQSDRKTGELNPAEILEREAFRDEYVCLLRGKEIIRTSKLLPLHPRIDEDRLIRCDGRLTNAEYLSYDVHFPILLPRKHPVTKLIVKNFHEKLNHNGGTNQVFAAVSSRYWIISGREEIRDWESQCAPCRFRKSKVMTKIMAPLPRSRLQLPLRAFVRVAVDYGGPFITIQGRRKRREKRYLCLFTCLLSRAVHLELAFGLDTDSFLNAFYRMVNRRGFPLEIISDNGTNIVGANKELCKLVGKLDTEKLQACTANKGIKWHFNPPLAPHFGGVHETIIKSAKRAIYAILGNADVTGEELMTAFTGAESLLNSRPLTYQSANPNDDVPLTPNHFLCGQVGGQDSVDYSDFRPQKRWRRIQELVKHFWQRWMREWLPGLNARKKWFHSERDIRIGDVVLVVSPDSARGQWPLGRILEVHSGKDGHARVVKVQVGKNVFVRPISKLCIIETSDSTAIMDSQ